MSRRQQRKAADKQSSNAVSVQLGKVTDRFDPSIFVKPDSLVSLLRRIFDAFLRPRDTITQSSCRHVPLTAFGCKKVCPLDCLEWLGLPFPQASFFTQGREAHQEPIP